MGNFIRAWSTRTEALIVLLGAFGYPLFSTAYLMILATPSPQITEGQLEGLLVFEPIVLLMLCAFLYVRGWTAQRLGLSASLRDTFIGIGLAIGAYTAILALWILCVALALPIDYLAGSTSIVGGDLRIVTVVAVSVVNALFEELFVCGYLITVAREHDRLNLGVNASVALRLAYHLYQGGVGVVAIIPFGLVFAWWYRKTGRLWPVVVAHAATDLTSLLQFVK